ncbi:DUF3618 domain-containing protein [Dermatobacter hominis]|uniref:DUF3618 domain-containing protein n=1 Tax=Dermatobacter hominis TaxID=2884263 RepID=UPI001D105FBB|nr:DUF3618 domain-containing protein [Dermatobacter hominis]UDY37501.1 DUF3618 domain-containing protein [Dermatobacter hominis]
MDTGTGELSTDELRRDIAARREDLGRDLDAIGDRLSPGRMVERTRGRARMRVVAVRDRVMGPARSTRSAMYDAKRHIGDGGGGTGTSVRDAPGDALHAVEGRVEGSPLAAGLVAFGIGFLAGSLMPATRSESDLAARMEPQLEDATRAVAQGAKEAAGEVAQVAKDEAAQVKDEATDAAGSVKETAQQHAAEAKDEVSGGGA